MVKYKRSRTPSKYIYYALYLYFSGLSLRKTSEHLLPFVKRNHVSVWKWIQHYRPKKILQMKRRKVQEFIVDETLLKVGNQYVWVWVAIEPLAKVILGIRISFERTMLVAERFLKGLVIEYGKHPLSTDGGGTWYPQACRFLNIEHHIHSLYERSIIEKEQSSTLRIEPNLLMTTFLVEKKSACYNMSEIGSIYLLTIIMRK